MKRTTFKNIYSLQELQHKTIHVSFGSFSFLLVQPGASITIFLEKKQIACFYQRVFMAIFFAVEVALLQVPIHSLSGTAFVVSIFYSTTTLSTNEIT